MNNSLRLPEFLRLFPDDTACLEAIKMLRFPNSIRCSICNKITKHYKIKSRTAYACKLCRNHVFPLADTIFEKTTTSLQLWFYAMLLMTYTRAEISAKQLQRELGVTYKTAWRMHKTIRTLMEQNDGDLLHHEKETIRKWTFFNKFEIKVVERQQANND